MARSGVAGLLLRGLVVSVLLVGCATDRSAPTTQPASVGERGEKALRDPFGYSPDFDESDISGGGLTDFDRKGFERDLGNVLNP